jgi:hypothetical protein
MKRLSFAFLAAVVVALSSFAAEPQHAEDLEFIRDLRGRGYSDLARQYLDKLVKTAPPALKKELELEIALTNMEAANDEPDSGKRLTLYAQARTAFQTFLKNNPRHPRATEAQLDIARATTLQGKTQLSRALLNEDKKARIAEGVKARATLVEAFNLLKKLPSTPETELAMALNLIDQSETYLNEGNVQESLNRSKPVEAARKILEKLASGEPSQKITWQARAWVGRCIHLLGEPEKAREKLNEITSSTGSAAQEGKRLARYFVLKVVQETGKPPSNDMYKTANDYLIKRARDWIREYPSYGRTPEGYGVRYLLAQTLLAESENPKENKRVRDNMVGDARKYLRAIEQTENDYTDRAKRLKLAAMSKQGLFKQPIPQLKTFEDCYVRAQYEISEISADAKKYENDGKQMAGARKARIVAAIDALQTGLKKPEAKKPSTEVNNAYAMLAFYLMNDGKYKEAVQLGETFARSNPKPSQAAMAAIYALLSYGELLSKREREATDAQMLQDDKQYQDDKAHMFALAKFMEARWSQERAGDLARHQIGLRLKREEKFPEAIQKLSAITPAYPSFIRTQFARASAALEQAKLDKEKGDPGNYRKQAITVLTSIPNPDPAADIDTNREYIQAKVTLGWELLKDRKFSNVDALIKTISPKMESFRLLGDPQKDQELRGKFRDNLVQLSLYSAASQAEVSFKAGSYADVTKRLDPLVDAFNAGKLPQLKDDLRLAAPILALALKSDVQLNKIDRATQVIKALQTLQSDKGGDSGTTAILGQLVTLISQQIDELHKKGDKEALKKAQAGFTTILNEVAKGQKTPTPKLAYLLAKCYAGMDDHKKAANLLETFANQPVAAQAGPDLQLHRAIQLLQIQELRQLKKTEQASKLLNEIITGKDGKPGWGARDLEAQKQRIMLMEDKEEYGPAARLCDRFITQLIRRLEDNKLKEQYFDFYYHLVYCILKNGQGLSNPEQKAKAVKNAAERIRNLERKHNGFGSEESKKRFENLLEKEADLREQYNALKGGK